MVNVNLLRKLFFNGLNKLDVQPLGKIFHTSTANEPRRKSETFSSKSLASNLT